MVLTSCLQNEVDLIVTIGILPHQLTQSLEVRLARRQNQLSVVNEANSLQNRRDFTHAATTRTARNQSFYSNNQY